MKKLFKTIRQSFNNLRPRSQRRLSEQETADQRVAEFRANLRYKG